MTELRHQVPGSSDEVESTELYLPDDSDAGTGEFTTTLKSEALTSAKVFWATVIHPPALQIYATFDPNMNVSVKLGLTDTPDSKNFQIPATVKREKRHTLQVHFSKWKITDALLDGEPLPSV